MNEKIGQKSGGILAFAGDTEAPKIVENYLKKMCKTAFK